MPPNSLKSCSIDRMASAEAVPMENAMGSIQTFVEGKEHMNGEQTPAVGSWDDFTMGNLLGSGVFAEVYEVRSIKNSCLLMKRLGEEVDSFLESRDVSKKLVIKKLKPNQGSSPEKLRRDLVNEVQILTYLCHKNIIRLHLCLWEYDAIVLERVVEDLETWLKRERDRMRQPRSSDPSLNPISLTRKLLALRRQAQLSAHEQTHRISTHVLGLAEGIAYLHKHSILHRDIKPANIGIDSQGVIKLMDFGSARRIGTLSNSDARTGPLPHALVGTFVYLAPEVYEPGRTYSFPADVYSFAIVAWETCTLLRPYPELKYVSQIKRCVLESGMRPPLRAVASKEMRKLLQVCWHQDPDKAPSMETVVKTLKMMTYSGDGNSVAASP